MSDVIQVTDPAQLRKLMEEIEGLKNIFSNAARKEAERGKRHKYEGAIRELRDADLPFIELSRTLFKNKSEASMRSQFQRTAKEMKDVSFVPSLVEYDGKLLLINFDAENAAEKFNTYLLKLSGIDEAELTKLAADLDANTK